MCVFGGGLGEGGDRKTDINTGMDYIAHVHLHGPEERLNKLSQRAVRKCYGNYKPSTIATLTNSPALLEQ